MLLYSLLGYKRVQYGRCNIRSRKHLSATQLNSELLPTCLTTADLETSPLALLEVACSAQFPSMILSTPATSTPPAPASWAPLCTVTVRRPAVSSPGARRPILQRDPTRLPASAQGIPSSAVPAKQTTLDLQDVEIWGLGPLDMETLASSLWDVGPASTAQLTFLPGAANPLVTNQPLALAVLDQLIEYHQLSPGGWCLRFIKLWHSFCSRSAIIDNYITRTCYHSLPGGIRFTVGEVTSDCCLF